MIMKKKMKELSDSQRKWNESQEQQYQENLKKKKLKKKHSEEKKEFSYRKLKEEFAEVYNKDILKKYYILSRAYKMGKDIYGENFTHAKLSEHFDCPYTTVKRILSLDRANERTWELIGQKKIGVYKVAIILMFKKWEYQDKIIDIVINENLSSTAIKKIIVEDDMRGAVKQFKLDRAVKEGYTRKNDALRSIMDSLERLDNILDVKFEQYPEKRLSDVYKRMKELKERLDKRLKELSSYIDAKPKLKGG